MRIICPSCATAYDIPARAIPVDGREVQCASCTHAWYQLPFADPAPTAAPAGKTPPPSAPHQSSRAAPSALDVTRLREALVGARPDPAPSATTAPPHAAALAWASDDSAPDDDAAADTDDAGAPPAPLRRRLSPEVLKVLRDEASFEARARQRAAEATEAAAPEAAQPDPETPMPAPPWKPQPAESLQARLRRLRDAQSSQDAASWEPGEEEDHADQQTPRPAVAPAAATAAAADPSADPARISDAPPSAAPAPPAPDLDPVRPARLRPQPTRAPDQPDPRPSGLPMVLAGRELALYVQRQEERRGFRWGFALTAGLFSLAAVLYLSAPALAAAFPAGAPVFDLVILGGERLRDSLILGLQALLERLGPASTG